MKPTGDLRFECTECGHCCTRRGEHAHVYVNRAEVGALARWLGTTVSAFRIRYTFGDEEGWTQIRFEGDRCPFLEPETNRCRVYPARPVQCGTFPFWSNLVENGRWTDQARELCEGVGQGPCHDRETVGELMCQMNDWEDEDVD